jgi:glycosyltransferase involved in cell wall biosynthesis
VFRAGGDVVHFQHEYGLFRREGSKYPGLMGLVFFPLVFLLSSLRGRPVVVTMHSVLTSQAGEASFSVRLYLLCMHKLLATGASHLIFLSPNCATAFRTDINPDSSTYSVLPHGVKRDIPDVQRDLTRRRLGYDSDDKVVAIPGFVRPPKGHDIFVEIARRLPVRVPCSGRRPARGGRLRVRRTNPDGRPGQRNRHWTARRRQVLGDPGHT